jgi:conjugal transfer pilus assembly protein TraV
MRWRWLGCWLSLGLVGCAAGMEETFRCGAVDGAGACVTMNQIHAQLDQGVLPHSAALTLTPPPAAALPEQAPLPSLTPSASPQRSAESVQELIIFPYVDAADNYHATSVVYVVLQPSHWSYQPRRPVTEEVLP